MWGVVFYCLRSFSFLFPRTACFLVPMHSSLVLLCATHGSQRPWWKHNCNCTEPPFPQITRPLTDYNRLSRKPWATINTIAALSRPISQTKLLRSQSTSVSEGPAVGKQPCPVLPVINCVGRRGRVPRRLCARGML
jgi:hypothetical protein